MKNLLNLGLDSICFITSLNGVVQSRPPKSTAFNFLAKPKSSFKNSFNLSSLTAIGVGTESGYFLVGLQLFIPPRISSILSFYF